MVWFIQGTGNANFYFAMNLVYATLQVCIPTPCNSSSGFLVLTSVWHSSGATFYHHSNRLLWVQVSLSPGVGSLCAVKAMRESTILGFSPNGGSSAGIWFLTTNVVFLLTDGFDSGEFKHHHPIWSQFEEAKCQQEQNQYIGLVVLRSCSGHLGAKQAIDGAGSL